MVYHTKYPVHFVRVCKMNVMPIIKPDQTSMMIEWSCNKIDDNSTLDVGVLCGKGQRHPRS